MLKFLITVGSIFFLQVCMAQSSVNELKVALTKKYEFEALDELFELAYQLPFIIPVSKSDTAIWNDTRNTYVELYLQWYQRMFDLGFELDAKAALVSQYNEATVDETASQREDRLKRKLKAEQKNKSIAAFLMAEQRLKKFVKKSFKANKRKNFQILLVAFESSYEKTVQILLDEVLVNELSFVIYDNKHNDEKSRSDSTIVVRN